MRTKFRAVTTHEDLTTHWAYRVLIDTNLETPKLRHQFRLFMQELYGEPRNRWSLRWSIIGVDIGFHHHKDFVKFMMFYTK